MGWLAMATEIRDKNWVKFDSTGFIQPLAMPKN